MYPYISTWWSFITLPLLVIREIRHDGRLTKSPYALNYKYHIPYVDFQLILEKKLNTLIEPHEMIPKYKWKKWKHIFNNKTFLSGYWI